MKKYEFLTSLDEYILPDSLLMNEVKLKLANTICTEQIVRPAHINYKPINTLDSQTMWTLNISAIPEKTIKLLSCKM